LRGQRYAFNWGLALVKAVMDQRKAEASYGIPADQLTPSVSWSAYTLRKQAQFGFHHTTGRTGLGGGISHGQVSTAKLWSPLVAI
jgi:hypothetical protein